MRLVKALRDEPLVRFGLVGLAIFAITAWLQPPAAVATDTIVIEQSRIDSWRDQFRSGNGRLPTAAELETTVTQWIDEEILYRQALLLGLHQNDSIVRRQLIQKMNFVVEGATPQPAASDEALQAYMQQHADRYATAEKISFQQVFLSRGGQNGLHGPALTAKAEALLLSLQQSAERAQGFSRLGDRFPLGAEIRNATPRLLRANFGKAFVAALQTLPASADWQGPLKSGLGLHLVRVTKRTAAQAPTLADVRKRVALDYRLEQEKVARRKTLDELRKSYTIEIAADSSNARSRAVANAQ